MIRPGFLDSESRDDLIELARDGLAEHWLARRANALVLLDKGMSCQSVAEALLLDNDTIRTWYQLYQEDGIEGPASFGHEGDTCRLTVEQHRRSMRAWIRPSSGAARTASGIWRSSSAMSKRRRAGGRFSLLWPSLVRTSRSSSAEASTWSRKPMQNSHAKGRTFLR